MPLSLYFSDEEKENFYNIDPSQADASPIPPISKDTLHTLRLAATYHRLNILQNRRTDIQTEIPEKRLKQAKLLYNSLA